MSHAVAVTVCVLARRVCASIHDREVKYYADGEDAYCMRRALTRESVGLPPLPTSTSVTAPTVPEP